jgi:hypothetical protein
MSLDRLITGRTVGLLYAPADYSAPRPGLLGVWRRHLVANAGVRSCEYMEALFRDRFPHGEIVAVRDGRLPEDALATADAIVLLFPDPLGMDFGWIERGVAARWPEKRLLGLNGRRRFFPLDRFTRRRLGRRRLLAAFRLPEFAFFAMFVVVTPLLALVDLARGRR